MTRKILQTVSLEDGNIRTLVKALALLIEDATASVTNVTNSGGSCFSAAQLVSEKLTDGSEVFNVELLHFDPNKGQMA